MGFWKVAGGIGAGVGTVFLLPVAGPVLAVTAIGAAVAGTAGGAAGVALSLADKKKFEKEREAAEEAERNAKKVAQQKQRRANALKKKKVAEKAQWAEEEAQRAKEDARKAKKRAKEALEKQAALSFSFIRETKDPLSTFIICSKLQISMAKADGEISKIEEREIEEFLSGLGDSENERAMSDQIRAIRDNPPSRDLIFKEIKSSKVSDAVLQGYLDLLVNVMRADGVIHQAELDFIDRFIEAFDSVKSSSNLPYRCLNLPRALEEEKAIVAFCLEPNNGRCDIWINNERRIVDKPLPNLSVNEFATQFDSDALEDLDDDIRDCSLAPRVHFVFCGEESVFGHAQKVIEAGGDRYSISRCPCHVENESV